MTFLVWRRFVLIQAEAGCRVMDFRGVLLVQRWCAGARGVSGETFECNFGRGILGILRFALNDTPSFLGLAEFSAGDLQLELRIPLGYARGRLFGFAHDHNIFGARVGALRR